MTKKSEEQERLQRENALLFPRSEYYTRFKDTTYFAMDDDQFWNTYHRSNDTRFYATQPPGGKPIYHDKKLHIYPHKYNSFHAHAGGYENPLNRSAYREAFGELPDRHPTKKLVSGSIYDLLLQERLRICQTIIATFELGMEKFKAPVRQYTKLPRKKLYNCERPIVYIENNFPCVMISMPFTNLGVLGKRTLEYEDMDYWRKHSKPFQLLLMAYYVGIVDYLAFTKGIPIELVMRAGFGHLNPSVAETDISFRLNTGIIPESYAQLLGDALVILYIVFSKFNDKSTGKYNLSSEQEKQLNNYNAYRGANINFDGTIWQMLRKPAQTRGDSLLSEMLRMQVSVEQLANYVLEEMRENKSLPTEAPLLQMMRYLRFSEKELSEKSKDYKISFLNLQGDYREEKWKKHSWPKQEMPMVDKNFWHVIHQLTSALTGKSDCFVEQKLQGLYSKLEKMHLRMVGGIDTAADSDDDIGSDSDCEQQLDDSGITLWAKKIITTTGMMAISCAFYSAQLFLKEYTDKRTYTVDSGFMYYEFPHIEKLIKDVEDMKFLKVGGAAKILFFDLNYCNAKNLPIAEMDLESQLAKKFDVIVLDITSAKTDEVHRAISTIYHNKNNKELSLLFLVSSGGLKHEAGGADNNPYGAVRVFSTDKKIRDDIYSRLAKSLRASRNYVHASSHRIRRRYKVRGFVPQNGSFLASSDS